MDDPARVPHRDSADAVQTHRPRKIPDGAPRLPATSDGAHTDRPHRAPETVDGAQPVADDTDTAHRPPDTTDQPDPVPDDEDRPDPTQEPHRTHPHLNTANRPHQTPETIDGAHPVADDTDAAHRAPDSVGRPDAGPDRAYRPRHVPDTAERRTDAPVAAPRPAPDTGGHPLPTAHAVERPHRPPLPAGVRRPPGGERLGRLPGPLGPDRLASRAPLYRSAAFDLRAQPAAVGTARRVVRELLTAWGVPQLRRDDAVLVISELVTNALVHTAGQRIACRLRGTADRIRIEVEDREGGSALPVARSPGPDDQHGRGLFLVDAVSLDWGVTPLPGRPARVVWAELPSGHG
ncbi:ATP-binding protein [Streptomyces sp. NPDC001135]